MLAALSCSPGNAVEETSSGNPFELVGIGSESEFFTLLRSAENDFLRSCLREEGFDIPPDVPRDQITIPPDIDIDIDFLSKNGWGISIASESSRVIEPGDSVGEVLAWAEEVGHDPQYQESLIEALTGPIRTDIENFDDPDRYSSQSPQGCFNESTQLLSKIDEIVAPLFTEYYRLLDREMASGSYRDAAARWSTCLGEGGYAEYTVAGPAEVPSLLLDEFAEVASDASDAELDRFQVKERDLAVSSFRCEEEAGVIEAGNAAELRALEELAEVGQGIDVERIRLELDAVLRR